MNTAQQIEKLRGRALLFSENLRSLIQTFEMLQPVAEDQVVLAQPADRRDQPGPGDSSRPEATSSGRTDKVRTLS
jgi:hypothetical protein